MVAGLLTELVEVNNKTRQQKQAGRIVKYLAKSDEPLTIPEIAKYVKISIPTATKLISELFDKNVIVELGKRDTGSGRKPVLYSLNKSIFYSVGIDIQLKGLRLVMLNMQFEAIKIKEIPDFILHNTEACLKEIIDHVNQFLAFSMIDDSSLLGIGVSLTGRVDIRKGLSLSYFEFLEVPLGTYLSNHFKLPVLIDNDTRLIGLTEQVEGRLSKVKDAFIINVSRGLGACIVCEGVIVKGSNGFAGEFGHMQFGHKNRLCLCGKANCLGTEVSGYALELDFTKALQEGRDSLLKAEFESREYRKILQVAMEGDSLAIDLIHMQGVHLGESLGNIINLLNPSIIVIAGSFAVLGDMFIDAIKIGLSKTTLINPLNNCQVVASDVDGTNAAAIGAAYLFFKKYDLL
jgi:predicted NBD/HSP70 family sugar kinase